MRNMPASQLQAQVNQLKHQRVNLVEYKKERKKLKPCQFQVPSSQNQQQNKLPQTNNSFKPLEAHVKPEYQASNQNVTCFKCYDTKHKPNFNYPANRYQFKNCKKDGHFTS